MLVRDTNVIPKGTPVYSTASGPEPQPAVRQVDLSRLRAVRWETDRIVWSGSGRCQRWVLRCDLAAALNNEPTKVCAKCGDRKPLSAFWIDGRRSDGRQTRCAACANRRRAETNREGPRDRGPMYVVEDRGYATSCWSWRWGKTSKGYGAIMADGRNQTAHRWVYERERGEIPPGFQLDHLCRNRACVNPDHLEPVTCAENIRRGQHAKLTYDDVDAIRRSTLSDPALGEMYGVSPSAIWSIRHGRNWVAPGGGPATPTKTLNSEHRSDKECPSPAADS